MAAPKEIIELVARFSEHVEAYRKGGLNETQLRVDFLNPLFEAFGWDVRNQQGLAEVYRDVIHEDAIKIGGNTKVPDYSFRRMFLCVRVVFVKCMITRRDPNPVVGKSQD